MGKPLGNPKGYDSLERLFVITESQLKSLQLSPYIAMLLETQELKGDLKDETSLKDHLTGIFGCRFNCDCTRHA